MEDKETKEPEVEESEDEVKEMGNIYCKVCDFKFKFLHNLDMHKINFHTAPPVKKLGVASSSSNTLKCDKCQFVAKNIPDLPRQPHTEVLNVKTVLLQVL